MASRPLEALFPNQAMASPSPRRWQDDFALPDWQSRLTHLPPEQEAEFMAWAQANRVPITDDYDMRAFWVSGARGNEVNANDGMMHYPDTYKTPLHESFSGESVYANPRSRPPTWNNRDQLVTSDGRVLFDERRRARQRRR